MVIGFSCELFTAASRFRMRRAIAQFLPRGIADAFNRVCVCAFVREDGAAPPERARARVRVMQISTRRCRALSTQLSCKDGARDRGCRAAPSMAGVGPMTTRERLEEVGLALGETRKQIAAERKRKARADTAETTVSPWRQRVALTMYILSQHRVGAPAAFLAGLRAQRSHARRAAAEEFWREIIEGWFLAASIDDIVALGAPEDASQCRVLRRARVFRAEHAVAQFVVQTNESSGVAPSTQALRREFLAAWRQQEECVVTSDTMPRAWEHSQTFAVWASRWRRRWGGRVGVLRPREHVPVEVRRQKALGGWGEGGGGICSQPGPPGLHPGRKFEAEFGAQIGPGT